MKAKRVSPQCRLILEHGYKWYTLKSEIEITDDITAGELEEKLAELGAETLKRHCKN